MTTFEQFLRESAVPRRDLEVFLDPDQPSWAQFDPELGYILGNYMPRDGLDGSLTISTSGANGARTSIIYANRQCRINTYGNSFTLCQQVSDHETWQEYLAAHLGEPIRNFGMGGYGVYQAYRRMLRTEKTADAAEYIVFYIWGDDHLRSLLRCRHALTHPWWAGKGGRLFHGNFWSHLEMDLEAGVLVDRENLLPTPEMLYKMADPGFMVEALYDDLMLQLCAFSTGLVEDLDHARAGRLAEILQIRYTSSGDMAAQRAQAARLCDAYAFAATKTILDRVRKYADQTGKKILIALFDPHVTRQLIQTGSRYDQGIVNYLETSGLRFFDMNLVHVEDFKCFRIPLDEYLKRSMIGHYSPAGNQFFAFAIKNSLVDMLDPKPVPYKEDDQVGIDFEGYLPGGSRISGYAEPV
jgi:hypothetical protein